MEPLVTKDPGMVSKVVRKFLSTNKPIFFDTETTSTNPLVDKLICIQLYQENSPVVIIDCRDMADRLRTSICPLFSSSPMFVGANIKFDYGFILETFGRRMMHIFDVMIAEQVLEGVGMSGAKRAGVSISLAGICNKRGISMSKAERNWFIGLDQRPEEWAAPFPPEQIAYAAHDVVVLEKVFPDQAEKLRSKRLTPVMRLEMEALPVFGEMEHNGIKVNEPGWREFIAEKQVEADALENELLLTLGPPILADRIRKYDEAKAKHDKWCVERDAYLAQLEEYHGGKDKTGWGAFRNTHMKVWREDNPNPGNPSLENSLPNIGSSPQLLVALEAIGVRKNGKPLTSTAEEVLKEVRDEYPIVDGILEFREKNKFVESFGETLLARIDEHTRRIHPDIIQIGADTGRSSVTHPNTQQWPSRGTEGKRLRALVIPEEGNVFVVNDYPNIELRIFAYMADCERMLDAFRRGEDLHTITARAMFGLSDDVDVKHTVAVDRNGKVLNGWSYRDIGKTTNFGIIYGMSHFKLARTLNTTLDEAQRLMDGYFEMYPEVKTYQDFVQSKALNELATHTLSGRPHYYVLPPDPKWEGDKDAFWLAKKEYRQQIGSIKRMASNYPIQGTSADITKKALGLLSRKIDLSVVKPVLVVHDEIVLECPAALGQRVAKLLEEAMTESCAVFMPDFPVPCVGANVATTWSKE